MFNENNVRNEFELAFRDDYFKDFPIQINKIEEEKCFDKYCADIVITATVSGENFTFLIEVKDTERRAVIRDAARQVKYYSSLYPSINPVIPFIAGRFFSKDDREIAKEEGVCLMDLAGNFYLNRKPIYLDKVVEKNPFSTTFISKDLFAPISSRISRVLLTNKDRLWKLGELAENANVSIGLASRIVHKMIQDEILIKNEKKQLQLKDPTYLLNKWRDAYLSNTSKVYRFYTLKSKEEVQNILANLSGDLQKSYALSYLTGAQYIAPFIIQLNKFQFYLQDQKEIANWVSLLELQSVDQGANVEIYFPYDAGVFYDAQKIFNDKLNTEHAPINVVSNIQLYLDLYNFASRGREQAEHLRELKIKF